MRPYPVFAFAVLALAACGQSSETSPSEPPAPAEAPVQQQQQAPPPEQADLTPASAADLQALGDGIASGQVRSGGECDPRKRGQVILRVQGQPDDGFRVILLCGSTEVARCAAHVSADPATSSCQDGPNPQPAGARRCIVGPRNGNSAAAAEAFSCPEV